MMIAIFCVLPYVYCHDYSFNSNTKNADGNALSGTIPTEIGSLTSLKFLIFGKWETKYAVLHKDDLVFYE